MVTSQHQSSLLRQKNENARNFQFLQDINGWGPRVVTRREVHGFTAHSRRPTPLVFIGVSPSFAKTSFARPLLPASKPASPWSLGAPRRPSSSRSFCFGKVPSKT